MEGTPRRLAVLVKGLEARQAAEEAMVKGPPAKAAFAGGGPGGGLWRWEGVKRLWGAAAVGGSEALVGVCVVVGGGDAQQ